jgi:hypothetical protein
MAKPNIKTPTIHELMESILEKPEPKLTEKQFIAKFKKQGFELYKTKDVKPKLDAFYKMQEFINKVK